jgi:hypothetical protein
MPLRRNCWSFSFICKHITNVTDALGYVYGSGSATVNGFSVSAISLSDPSSSVVPYLQEFTTIENAHGQFLIGALSGNPYIQPPASGSSVQFAFGLHTLTTAVEVADAVYGAELTGVSAYLGAIPSLTQKSPYLQIAASIQGTEARHTAALAAVINAANSNGAIETAPQYNEGFHSSGIDVPLTPDQILNGAGATAGIAVPGGTILPVSGPKGAAVGGANQTAYSGSYPTTTFNGFVYLVTTP